MNSFGNSEKYLLCVCNRTREKHNCYDEWSLHILLFLKVFTLLHTLETLNRSWICRKNCISVKKYYPWRMTNKNINVKNTMVLQKCFSYILYS